MTAPLSSLGSNPIVLAPRALLGSLFSFEALLVLYMFAGFYKTDPRFAWLPVDATMLFFALCVVTGSFIIVLNPIHKKGLPVAFAMVCFVVWFLVSLMWSPSKIYGPSKVFFMATLELWALVASALIIAPDLERVRRLLSLILLFSIWVATEALLAYGQAGGTVVQIGDVNYLMLGRICGLGALVALVAWLCSRGLTGSVYLILFLILGFVIAIAGGRGPFIGAAMAVLIPVGLAVRLTTTKIKYSRTLLSVVALLLAMAGTVTAYTLATNRLPGTFKRFERLWEGVDSGMTMSEGDRVEHYATAYELWSQAPLLGHGAGSWPILTGRPDDRFFPHNMFLEVGVEAGLIGLALLGVLFATALRSVSLERLRQDPQALCSVMLLTAIFMDCMVSGDLADNRQLFMLLGLMSLLALRPGLVALPTTRSGLFTRLVAPTEAAGRLRQPGLLSTFGTHTQR